LKTILPVVDLEPWSSQSYPPSLGWHRLLQPTIDSDGILGTYFAQAGLELRSSWSQPSK
jgi:hypothetical protein